MSKRVFDDAIPSNRSDVELVDALRGDASQRDWALFALRAFLVSIASFELDRRRPGLHALSDSDAARLVRDAGDAAYARVLERLGDYHGQSRFKVWAAKFAIHETAAAARKTASLFDTNEATNTAPSGAKGGV